jgi:hypothetical protein
MDRYLEISLVLWMSFIHKNDRHKISWVTPNKDFTIRVDGGATKLRWGLNLGKSHLSFETEPNDPTSLSLSFCFLQMIPKKKKL